MLLWHYILFVLWVTTSVSTVNRAKIEPKILENSWPSVDYRNMLWPNVFVSFGSTQSALEAAKRARSSGTIAERAGNVRTYLMKLAEMDQAGVINMLSKLNEYEFKSMWVSNRIFIRKPNKDIVYRISDFANVTYIKEETRHDAADKVIRDDKGYTAVTYAKVRQTVPKGLQLIHAPEAWKVLGGTRKAGEGVIVGVLATGTYTSHDDLSENFLDSNYSNYGYLSAARHPVVNAARFAQGTHDTGIIVGRNGIGVAPAAKHSQCRSCEDYYCFEQAFEECIAFFICPTLQWSTLVDCSRRVHVIHLSFWDDSPSIKPILDAARSAGIILVAPLGQKWFATGNCNQGTYPGLFDEVIAVGIVNNEDQLYEKSPRGPNPNSKGNPKPDVVAPGVDILSAHWNSPEYIYLLRTGSLTATAHVTGLVALLLTRDKTLTQDQVRKIIIENTDRPVPNVWGCDNKTQNNWPNSEFGYGRINALKALNAQTLMLTGGKRNETKLENACEESFANYKKRHNDNLRKINSVNIEIRKDIQRSIADLEVIAHEIDKFNATLKTLLDKANQLEKSLKSLQVNLKN